MAGGLNLYGYADGDPINKSDPFGLCPYCEGVVQALSRLAPSLQRTLELGAVAVMAPIVVVAEAEVAATAGVQQVASAVRTTLARTAAHAEGQGANSGTLSFVAGDAAQRGDPDARPRGRHPRPAGVARARPADQHAALHACLDAAAALGAPADASRGRR